MTLIAELWLAHPDLVLSDALAATEATVRLDYQTAAEPDDRYLFLRVSGVDPDAFGRALASDHTVSNPRLVAMFPDGAVFRVDVETELEVVPTDATVLGARVMQIRSDGTGWRVRLHLFTRDALDAIRNYCRETGITYEVRELSNVDNGPGDYDFGLTEQQRTTLLLAHNAGYYKVPRIVSQSDVAAELDISKSAVSQRLRRAIETLLDNTIAGGEFYRSP